MLDKEEKPTWQQEAHKKSLCAGSFCGPLLFSFLFKIHLLIGGILNGKNVHEHNDDDVYGKDDVRNELHEHDDGSNARNGHGNEYGSNDV